MPEFQFCKHVEGTWAVGGTQVGYTAHVQTAKGVGVTEYLHDVHVELDRVRPHLPPDKEEQLCRVIAQTAIDRYLMGDYKEAQHEPTPE